LRTIWALRGGVVTPVQVAVGRGDGRVTAILSGDLAEGDQVITGLAAQ
jgi:hypothetical protein